MKIKQQIEDAFNEKKPFTLKKLVKLQKHFEKDKNYKSHDKN